MSLEISECHFLVILTISGIWGHGVVPGVTPVTPTPLLRWNPWWGTPQLLRGQMAVLAILTILTILTIWGVPEAVLGVIWTPKHVFPPASFDYNRGHMEVFWVIWTPLEDPPGGSWGPLGGVPWVPLPGFQRNRGVGVPGVTPG